MGRTFSAWRYSYINPDSGDQIDQWFVPYLGVVKAYQKNTIADFISEGEIISYSKTN